MQSAERKILESVYTSLVVKKLIFLVRQEQQPALFFTILMARKDLIILKNSLLAVQSFFSRDHTLKPVGTHRQKTTEAIFIQAVR